MQGMGNMSHGGMSGMGSSGRLMQDINDIDYDAYIANDRTLADPHVVRVERGARVRLRVINGAAATNFHVDPGVLTGELIAVDGDPRGTCRRRLRKGCTLHHWRQTGLLTSNKP